MEANKRACGLDIIRVLAVLFVIAFHFFWGIPYYSQELYGGVLYGQTILRWLFFTCVPLFLILTGYLKCNKKLEKSHYKSIIHILVSYIFVSICVIFFKIFYLNDDKSIIDLILGILDFSTLSYAWYIEMYIGLFLLIPFLNILYKNIDTKKNKQLLILTLFLLTSIVSFTREIEIMGHFLDIFPDWWSGIYPLTYYFIGCYIKEYQPTLPKLKNIILICVIIFIQGSLSYFLSYGDLFNQSLWNSYGNLLTLVAATLIFLLLYKVDIKQERFKEILKNISILALDIYLFSYIGDKLFYPLINQHIENYREYILLFFIMVPLLFVFAYALANIKKLVVNFITFIIKKNKKTDR